MHKSSLKSFLIAATVLLAAAFGPAVSAQVVTSAINGTVTDGSGKALSGATVTAVHTPTNTTFTATTNASGRYGISGMPVGGPYTVTAHAEGNASVPMSDVTTELGNTVDVNLTVKSEVVQLEKFVTTAARNDLDSSATGVSTLLTSARLAAKPTTQRSLADLVSATPGVTLRALSGDREEAMLTAVGQNNRYNKWMIDGNGINDQFGLNSTGLASFFNPIALDTIEQISVKTSEYDVHYRGFTGAAINAVTKSGTNEFHGVISYIRAGDHYLSMAMQGPNYRAIVAGGAKFVPPLKRTTKSVTFGGPIIPDRLFFFLNWEKFERIGAPAATGLPTVAAADLALINARVAAITKVKYGALGGNASSIANDEKKLLKLDWNITKGQRLSARYSTTEGQVPQFGSFTTTSFGSGSSVGTQTPLVGGAATAFDSHFYAQQRKEKSYSLQLFSTWTPDLKSEIQWSHVKQDQYTPTATIAPEIDIYGVTGTNAAGAAVTNGVVVLGTERFRHRNQINVDTKNYSASADYSVGDVTLTAGFDVEANDYANLFRSLSYGVFNYKTPTDFANDAVYGFQRNFTDLALKGTYAEVSQYTQTGMFAQAKWTYSNRLNFRAGFRYDKSSSSTKPAFNQQFLTDTGMRNDGTVNGATDVSPRFSFNWALDEARKTQLRGGYGYFVGRSPWVFFSNSYGNSGVGTFSVITGAATGGLTSYLASSFDPASPMGTATQTPGVQADVALTDAGMHMPSLWRGNLSLDHQVSFLDSVFSIDLQHSVNDHTIYITNDNLKKKGVALDGRTYFTGSLNTQANRLYPSYINIYHTRNVKAGSATYMTLSWARPMKKHWAFNIDYTRGKSTEAQANGQTTASGAWQRNVVFNQGTVETGTSDFEVKDRIQASLSREFEFVKNCKTTASLYYEGRTGSPYSYAYSGDLNQDGFSGNDAVAIPTSQGDSRFDFSAMTQANIDAMFASISSLGLNKYAGGYAPKNAFYQPWVSRLDLSIKQQIPLHFKTAKLELVMDFTNFGTFISKSLFNYTYRAPSTVNDVFDRRLVGNATIDNTTGKIKPTTWAPADFLVDDTMSRWRIQVSARLSF